MGKPFFKEFWERNMEESVRQGNSKPFVEEAILQVSSWGFDLAELQVPKNPEGNGLLKWLKSFYPVAEREWTGFTGPIHIWQVRTHCHRLLHSIFFSHARQNFSLSKRTIYFFSLFGEALTLWINLSCSKRIILS